jgi:MFS family permease
MDSLIAADAPQEAGAVPQKLTVRDRLALAVMVSGGWWMALIFTAIAPVLSTMSDALGGPGNGYWIGQLTMTIPDIGIIFGGPIAGLLVERYIARMLLLASFALYAVIMAIGAALNGAGGGMANPYFAAAMIDRAPVAACGRAIGLLYTNQFFGEFMNPFVVTRWPVCSASTARSLRSRRCSSLGARA